MLYSISETETKYRYMYRDQLLLARSPPPPSTPTPETRFSSILHRNDCLAVTVILYISKALMALTRIDQKFKKKTKQISWMTMPWSIYQ